MWTRLTRAVWLSTLAVAVVAYFSVGVAQLIVRWMFSSASTNAHHPLDLIVIFPVVVIIGYLAERIRRRAAVVLGAMLLLAISLMTFSMPENIPLWYRIAWFFVGPAAAVIGSVLPSPRR